MTNSDEYKNARETALYKFTAGGTIYEEDHFRGGFDAGYEYALSSEAVQGLVEALEDFSKRYSDGVYDIPMEANEVLSKFTAIREEKEK